MLEGCADGVCAGGCVAGAYVDFCCCAGVGTIVINAVGYITGNAFVLVAGFAGFFGRIVVHSFKILSIKNYERCFSFVIYYDSIVFILFIQKKDV